MQSEKNLHLIVKRIIETNKKLRIINQKREKVELTIQETIREVHKYGLSFDIVVKDNKDEQYYIEIVASSKLSDTKRKKIEKLGLKVIVIDVSNVYRLKQNFENKEFEHHIILDYGCKKTLNF